MGNPAETYQLRSDDVASEAFDGEFVVLDLKSGKYFSLSGASAIVWRGIVAGHSVASICGVLPEADPRRDGIAGLVASLVANGLIVATPESRPRPDDTLLDLVGAVGPFGMEMFDDLADLLVADPVHDVDQEAGWPHRPSTRD